MPNNKAVIDVKPNNFGVVNVKPKLSVLRIDNNETIYTETRTIVKGSPMANGFFMFLTYPSQLIFTATRI